MPSVAPDAGASVFPERGIGASNETAEAKQPDAALMAARAAAWLRFIDTVWAGDRCGHAEVDLMRVCRTCGEVVADVEAAQ